MKNLLLAWLSVLLLITVFNGVAIAKDIEKPTVVLFSATWNASSRNAKNVIPAVIKKHKHVNYIDLDVDKPATIDAAKDICIKIPDSTPYLYLVSKNGKILYESVYRNIDEKSLDKLLYKYMQDD